MVPEREDQQNSQLRLMASCAGLGVLMDVSVVKIPYLKYHGQFRSKTASKATGVLSLFQVLRALPV